MALSALAVRNLSKHYALSNSGLSRIRAMFSPSNPRPDQGLWALRDVSFSVERGEALGIIGANGAGKSTLLQLIAGIIRPTSGTVEVNGRISALLELGSGFSPEFTGRENVFLNASILGLSTEEIEARFPAIEAFAEIGDFINQPIRICSTGMVLRLAFAVAVHSDPDILIVDEALAVGDIAFRQRCMRRIHELRAQGITILFVSHDASDVKALCERCVWLEGGIVRETGNADDVTAAYLAETVRREHAHIHDPTPLAPVHPAHIAVAPPVTGSRRFGDGSAAVIGMDVLDAKGKPARAFQRNAALTVRISVQSRTGTADPLIGFLLRNEKGETILGMNTGREDYPVHAMAPGDIHTADFHWTLPALAPGRYAFSGAISEGVLEDFTVCDWIEDAVTIDIQGSPMRGYLELPCRTEIVHRSHN